MKTDELITLLASDAAAVSPRVWRQRYALALGVGVLGASLLMLQMLGVRPDINEAVALPMFWVKLGFPALLGASSDDRSALLWGETWSSCLINVPMLAVPAFVLLLGVLKTLAPVRPALAGAAAGALSGGLGALAYALHCPELAPAFIGLWYLLGMLIPAALGALIGARLLRW